MVKELPRIDDKGKSIGEDSSDSSGDISTSPQLCSLHFKGLVIENSLAGFGVAIFGTEDELLFQMKGPIHHDSTVTALEADLTALNRGLTEATSLGITHLSIYCDYYPIYELVMGRFVPDDNKSALLMIEVQRIRERFKSSFPIMVDENSLRYAYKLARETIASEISIPVNLEHQAKATRKTTCNICLGDDIDDEQFFYVVNCRHRFCSECMKQHISVRLHAGSVMRCPHYRCKSELTLGTCENLLTPELREMWLQRIKENLIPVTERIYCPNPRCSALMSETELSVWTRKTRVKRCCLKCGQFFCINCKVLWHRKLSCDKYKRLHPYATENEGKIKALANQKMWRQCVKCQHMIELSEGCVRVQCRCGHIFCYRCGAEAGRCDHGHGLPPQPHQPLPPSPPPPPPPARSSILCVIFVICFLWIPYFICNLISKNKVV